MKQARNYPSRSGLAAVSALLLTALSAPIVHAANYAVVDLGTLGGTTSFARSVNNSRQVTGNAQTPVGQANPRLNAYSYSGSGPITNIGTLAGSNNFSRGYAINDSGVIVGESDNNTSRAFVFRDGVMTGLTRLAGDNDRGVAHGINNAGLIVGISSNGSVSRPTLWSDTGSGYIPSDLGTIAGTASSTGRAWAINQNGVATGLSTNASGTSQATLWNGGAITNLTSLGDGTRFSQGYALNASNTVVGSSSTGQTVGELIGTTSTTSITRAFTSGAGGMTELSPFNLYSAFNNGATTNYHSVASDINDAGIIVGNSQRISGSPAVATIWIDGIATDLNSLIPADSGWNLLSAEGINEAGDIVGFGSFQGANRAFLLTVPEPSTALLAAFGAIVLFRRKK